MDRFLDPFYPVNALLVLVYFPLRVYFTRVTPEGSDYSRLHSLHEFSTWEWQALVTVLAVIAWKGLRRRSWDHLAQQFFFYGKLVVALTAVMVDVRLLVWYGLAALAAWVAFPQPIINMLAGQGNVKELRPTEVREWVLRGADTWLVYFYTESHTESIAMAPAFVELADRYAPQGVKFGVFDACLWPRYARELKLRPNIWSNQLPAVVMYSRGQEQGRIPAASQTDELGIKKNYYTKRDIIKKFGLDDGLGQAGKSRQNAKANGKQR